MKADIVAVGVKPTISGYEPDELGLLAISAKLLYHILDKFSIIKYKTDDFTMQKIKMSRSVSLTFEEGCNKYLENCRQRNLREGNGIE